jgi:hypothetical protein
MSDWVTTIAAMRALPEDVIFQMESNGFVVLPPVFSSDHMCALTDAYDAVEATATEPDKRIGSTSTRVSDFVNHGAIFDELYLLPPLLDAACRIISRPFKLSSFQSRTVHAHAAAQDLHVDVRHDSRDWPLVGFILMIDEFRSDNGATRFIPGSHRHSSVCTDRDAAIVACGPSGSLLIYDGSTWHGHSANTSATPRRSLQGAFIPRDGKSGTDFAQRMSAETRERLSPLAKYLLCV